MIGLDEHKRRAAALGLRSRWVGIVTPTPAQQAADPKTSAEVLADLAYDHPELRAVIAANPSTYSGLLEWLGERGDADVDSALRKRAAEFTGRERAADPGTDPAMLADLAYEHPELRETIAGNPSAYEGLRTWIASAKLAPAPAQVPVATVAVPPASPPVPPVLPILPSPAPLRSGQVSSSPKARRRATLIAVAVASVLLFIVGVVVVTTGNNVHPQNDQWGGDWSIEDDVSYWDSASTNRVDGMPYTLPGCPEGASVMAWTVWPGGGVLECRYASTWEEIVLLVDGDNVMQASAFERTSGRLVAEVGNGYLEISLGGWLVVDDGVVRQATSAWTLEAGSQSFLQLPGDLATCPANTVSTSLSIWNGGWLLTCGTYDNDMASFLYSAGSRTGAGGSMSGSGAGWCGAGQRGEAVCVNSSPAVATVSESGTRRSYTASGNYFDDFGFGGAGKGTGAYGVDSPEDTAMSQVQYLVDILNESAAARSTVRGVLAPLNACQVSGSDVEALRTLTQSRTDLLEALDYTPVDQIPNGEQILDSLRTALQLSETADKGYVDSAITMSRGDCNNGRTTYRSALSIADKAESAKVAFVQLWNSTIAGKYGVKSLSSDAI